MEIFLYNTLTHQKEQFKPLKKGAVSMYHCGPTVYNFAQIGNLRSYVFADTLRRMFEASGFTVRQIINITDFGHLTSDADEGEDKMMKGLKREGKPITMEAMKEMARFYTAAFKNDLKALNVKMPHALPYASEHIPEYIELIRTLETKGFLYTIPNDGVYFDISKFPRYGKLLGVQKSVELTSRIGVNVHKKNPQDFAVWKFNTALGWESPWGHGFPGWHIECSGMSMKYLGETFDIHTGGIDHLPVHHPNEIAQSEGATGKPLARYWLHNNFVTITGEKISKSLKNDVYLNDVIKRDINPLAYRYWLLTAHYRTPVDFTWETLAASEQALSKLYDYYRELENSIGAVNKKYKTLFIAYIYDDLNTPRALSVLWRLIKDKKVTLEDKKATLLFFDTFLGLKLSESDAIQEEIPQEVKDLVALREDVRKQKNWGKADDIREDIQKLGFTVKDTASGSKISKWKKN